ncbi:hypothetical protein OF829_10505 [Sphingomonas sp. LB-2]|uniref:hypothetical protein n=1 Tax=Sphingomonas caeni TaxID=2984949 RepID=UPI00222FDA8B|nr:hypothetical protein [Sphingomonas caeni]MCW3847673.1 hypothetical protein [Sphingomonas caeni]
MRVHGVMLLGCAVALAGCKPAEETPNFMADANFAADVNAVDTDIRNVMAAEGEQPPPSYVAGPDDAKGENAMTDANPGQIYYRDLPAARLLRGDWTVRKTAWFAVSGKETEPRSLARLDAFDGAKVRIDRRRILVTPRASKPLAKVTLDCTSVGYLDKDRLTASENLPGRRPNTREDVVIIYGIAVAEREISAAFAQSQSVEGQVLSLLCPESDQGDAEEGVYPVAWLSGAMLIDRNRMVLIFTDGTTLYAERDPQ